jgi:transglutaminase-like putative cysteine protease
LPILKIPFYPETLYYHKKTATYHSMPRFKIHHVTRYVYEAPVRDSANQIILFPIRDEQQEVSMQELRITGDPEMEIFKDYYGNEVGTFTHAEPHEELTIDSKVEVITLPKPQLPDSMPAQTQWAELMKLQQVEPFVDFLTQEPFGALNEVMQVAGAEGCRECTPFELARRFSNYVYSNFKYIKGITTVESTLDEVWNLKAGVCQDFAHILLVMLRTIRIPARYVSGYICPDRNGMRGEGATHAWVEAYIPSGGWIGLDPTNNCIAADQHVRLAVGRNFSDCSPVKGTYKGISGHTLEVGVSVSYEDGHVVEEAVATLTPQPVSNGMQQNSYRRYMEMIQQQQQQQQQQ